MNVYKKNRIINTKTNTTILLSYILT